MEKIEKSFHNHAFVVSIHFFDTNLQYTYLWNGLYVILMSEKHRYAIESERFEEMSFVVNLG